jgi:dTDP-4-amino-4,6-dideoxygalactose transaminase
MPLYPEAAASTLPATDAICDRIMTLPIGAAMDVTDAEYVITQLREVLPR